MPPVSRWQAIDEARVQPLVGRSGQHAAGGSSLEAARSRPSKPKLRGRPAPSRSDGSPARTASRTATGSASSRRERRPARSHSTRPANGHHRRQPRAGTARRTRRAMLKVAAPIANRSCRPAGRRAKRPLECSRLRPRDAFERRRGRAEVARQDLRRVCGLRTGHHELAGRSSPRRAAPHSQEGRTYRCRLRRRGREPRHGRSGHRKAAARAQRLLSISPDEHRSQCMTDHLVRS